MNAEATIDPVTYTVYVHDDPGSFKSWSGNVIGVLWVWPGDRVICINTTAKKLKITFGDGTATDTVFGQIEVDIESEKRKVLTVLDNATEDVTCNITPYESTSVYPRAAPKVVVGNGP